MFGIRGLDGFGLAHAAIGIVALLLGFTVVLLRKGTAVHRKVGLAYVGTMLMLNLTALWIYDLTGRFGPFHVAALISLATLAAGYIAVRMRRRSPDAIAVHGILMSWSYVGLIAAFFAELAVRVPGVGFSFGVLAATATAVLGGALLIHTRVPAIARALLRL